MAVSQGIIGLLLVAAGFVLWIWLLAGVVLFATVAYIIRLWLVG
ncbi:MAG: hypothetical protein OXR62_11185 [Ahrensia sp.]|nr:hypothetical protein [Ahrensia sp.]